MTDIRTFFWHARIKGPLKIWIKRHVLGKSVDREFAIGNAGDIFAQNLVSHFYDGAHALNSSEGPRLLCVGSIVHKAEPGDVLCGVGSKGSPLPEIDPKSALVHGLRGPLTEAELSAAGYDTSTLKWYGDPGLTICNMLPPRDPIPNRVIFIPHYRERSQARALLPKGIRLVDIDADPLVVGQKIQEAELVYASSLHGIIFAHSLGRPVVMVRPMTPEPLTKFEDYHLGVGLTMPEPLDSITMADFKAAPGSPARLSVAAQDITFPDIAILKQRGISTE